MVQESLVEQSQNKWWYVWFLHWERECSMNYQMLGDFQKWSENQSSFKVDSNPEANDDSLSKLGWKLVLWELLKESKC
jgi:hypothetical protein